MSGRSASLRRNLLLRLWLPLIGLLLASAAAAYALARHYAEQVYDRWLWDSAMSLATLLHTDVNGAHLELPQTTMRMFEWDSTDRVYAQVVSRRNGRLFGDAQFPPPPKQDRNKALRVYDGDINGEPVRVVAVDADLPADAHDAVTISVAETGRKRSALAWELLLASVPLQLLVLALAALLIWHAVESSMRMLGDATRRLVVDGSGALAPLAELERSPLEIRPLGQAINTLVGRLGEAQQAQQRLVANAAHQLRTPLAALQVQAERALREADPAEHGEALAHVLVAVTRLRHLTHQILTLSRSEAADATIGFARVDLAALAREEIERHSDRAIEHGIDLGYEGHERDFAVHGQAQLLHELVANLLDNALAYTPRGGTVTLELREAPPTLLVDDDGPGIAAEERELVFERFHRGRDAGGDGCGLGMAIAREIALRHGACITLETPPGGHGTRVRVDFPDPA